MNPPQSELILMGKISQPNEETQELVRLFHETKKTLPILSHTDLTEKSVNPVSNAFLRYETNHERLQLSINDVKDVTVSLFNASSAVQNPEYHESSNKPVKWLQRFMKAYKVDFYERLMPKRTIIHS